MVRGNYGRFLELSLPTADILASLAFYRALGFAELATGDIRAYHYAVVTDGHVALGLHSGGPGEVALSFVLPDVAACARALVAAGHALDFRRLGIEEFNEAGLRDPAGNLVWLLEAPTFSPALASAEPPATGQTVAIALPGDGEDALRSFWTSQGFVDDDAAPAGILRLLAPGLVLELDPRLRGPVLRLRGAERSRLAAVLDRAGFAARHSADTLLLSSPEGLTLAISD